MEIFLNNKPNLMFHEILDDNNINSGWHHDSKGKYTISRKKFKNLILNFGNSVNYTFDDGGISNLYASIELNKNNIKGFFFIATSFVNKPGFLNVAQIKTISKNHFVFAHGHEHLMNNFSFEILYNDWKKSLNFMKINGFNAETVCLPGGTYSKTHHNVFIKLGVKNIFHSAPNNCLINFMYGKQINFLPRFIVQSNFDFIKKLNFSGFKSIIKQLLNYYK